MKQETKKKRKRQTSGICYLCGKGLNGKINKDHIPPRQMFPTQTRQAYNLSKLDTRLTHESCNESYQEDEKYFAEWMAAMAEIKYPDLNPKVDLHRRNEEAEQQGTAKSRFMGEMGAPNNILIYNSEGDIVKLPNQPKRIDRVIWKIIRGLYFIENKDKITLPENPCPYIIGPIQLKNQNIAYPSAYSLEERQITNDLLNALKTRPPMGKYPAIFDYRYNSIPVSETPNLRRYTWVLILHGSIVIFVTFETQQHQ